MMSKTKILLIEDSQIDRRLVRELILRSDPAGFHLDLAATLAEAALLLKKGMFDLILLDLVLPDTQGISTFQKIKRLAPEVPIVVLTSMDDESSAIQAIKCGAQDYLYKSQFDKERLARSIRYAIERHKLLCKLKQADRLLAMGQLSGAISHEINNPLAVIALNLSSLQASIDQIQVAANRITANSVADMKAMIRDSVSSLDRIKQISGRVRAFNRPGKAALTEVSMNDLIEAACSLVENDIRHRARLIKRFGSLPAIVGDPGRLVQAITNILLNAAQAIQEGNATKHEVRVVTTSSNGVIKIEITDTGCGVPSELRDRIFEPFYTTKAESRNTGLGLTLAAEIIKEHKGSISMKNVDACGSCFEVTIPASSSTDSIAAPTYKRKAENQSGERLRLLVIDDEELLLRSFKRILESDYEVTTASGGKEGLSILRQDTNFGAVLCDLMMPEIDGVEVYDQIQSLAPKLTNHLLFISGGAFTERVQSFLNKGQHTVLDKPIAPNALREQVAQIISS